MIGIGVVNTVNTGPPQNGSLERHRSKSGKNDSHRAYCEEGTMGEMPMEPHFDADECEDIHNGTGCYFGRSSATAPRHTGGDQDAEKRKNNR
jgi:hypothetical protein